MIDLKSENAKSIWWAVGIVGLVALAFILYTMGIAGAQEPTLAGATTVTVNELLVPWYPVLIPAVSGFVLALATWATVELKRRTGIALDAFNRDTLQKAVENAAGKAVMIMGDKLKHAEFDVKHPAIRQAIVYVNEGAADAVKGFGLTDDQIAEKIIAKIGVITAANPVVDPKDITPPPPDPGKGG